MEISPELVIAAYRQGIFPMGDDENDLIYWFRPDPRAILPLEDFHIPRSLQHAMDNGEFEVTANRAFTDVMIGCGEGRPVWITDRIHDLYNQLHELKKAHSVEVWNGDELIGGIYGVQIGGVFMAESKFHRVTNASKIALVKLVERLREGGFALLDVQYLTDHLRQFGVLEISNAEYLLRLEKAALLECEF